MTETRTHRNGALTLSQRRQIRDKWKAYVSGNITIMEVAADVGVSAEMVRQMFKALSDRHAIRREVGASFSREMENEKKRTASLRPKGVSAEPFSELWWKQNQESAERHFQRIWDEVRA